jgi:hypothetical protein
LRSRDDARATQFTARKIFRRKCLYGRIERPVAAQNARISASDSLRRSRKAPARTGAREALATPARRQGAPKFALAFPIVHGERAAIFFARNIAARTLSRRSSS